MSWFFKPRAGPCKDRVYACTYGSAYQKQISTFDDSFGAWQLPLSPSPRWLHPWRYLRGWLRSCCSNAPMHSLTGGAYPAMDHHMPTSVHKHAHAGAEICPSGSKLWLQVTGYRIITLLKTVV
jgi:hypothetical protein